MTAMDIASFNGHSLIVEVLKAITQLEPPAIASGQKTTTPPGHAAYPADTAPTQGIAHHGDMPPSGDTTISEDMPPPNKKPHLEEEVLSLCPQTSPPDRFKVSCWNMIE